MRKRDNFVFAAFALSLILLFLQQFYFKNTPASIIHAIDILILLFVISETFFAVRQEKYICKYFQNNLVDFLAVLIFALTFIIFKIQIGFKPAGGINSVMDAIIYYTIVKEVLGEKWLTNQWFRMGTSRLANLLLSEILEKETKFF